MIFEDHLNKISLKNKAGLLLNATRDNKNLMSKIARGLYQPYKWLIFFPFLSLSTFFLSIPALFLTFFFSAKAASLTVAVLWARLNCWVTPVVARVEGKEHIDNNRSYVIVSNHQSHFDILLLYGWLGIDIKWVMKSSLRNVPIIGYVCEKMEHIYIKRSDTKAALASINNAKKKIRNGTSVIFFPEGTRSETEALGPFKKGAFKFAVDMGLPILPITITGTHKILPKHTLDLFPGKVRMIIHPPIEIADDHNNNVNDLMKKSREIIRASLQTLPPT